MWNHSTPRKVSENDFFLTLNKTRPRWRSEMDSQKLQDTQIAQLAVGKALEDKIVLNIAVCQRMVQIKSDRQSQTRLLFAEERR